ISVMGGEQAADVLLQVKLDQRKGEEMSEAQREAFRRPIIERYEREGSAYYATARLWDDGIIEPTETRKVIALGIAMSLNAPIPDHRFGIFRM
ncbi:MAG: methylcrotonoyl-CoA carboxylase, partial [Deltaproteobacteria bacterium]